MAEESYLPGSAIRLAVYLAHAGVASRRNAEKLIAAGRVQVNGVVVRAQGTRIFALRDSIQVDNSPVIAVQSLCSILLHKPAGYLSTTYDPRGRPTVLDFLPLSLQKMRLYPAGRLDSNTSGLLLLTNDGKLAIRVTHPRYGVHKKYTVVLNHPFQKEHLHLLQNGILIPEDGDSSFMTSPAEASIDPLSAYTVYVTLHEGHKRQIRRMFSVLGYTVRTLVRIAIGPVLLGELPVGAWRYLLVEERDALEGMK